MPGFVQGNRHGKAGECVHSYVVALIESRSREVGLAGVTRSMEFELTQFSDTASYSRTISAVLAADPSAVLVSRSARGTQLVQLLEQALGSRLTFLERRHFDEAEGQNLLDEAIVVGLQQADFASKFAAAASFTALWRYIESSSDVRLVTSSCRVTFRVACDVFSSRQPRLRARNCCGKPFCNPVPSSPRFKSVTVLWRFCWKANCWNVSNNCFQV
eukprot:symbB.v1.2.013504.t1/scaffold959.1/size148843/13